MLNIAKYKRNPVVHYPERGLPEALFAFVTEDIGHGSTFALLDQRIGIDDIDAQTPCQLASQGALAATHITDQE